MAGSSMGTNCPYEALMITISLVPKLGTTENKDNLKVQEP